MAKTKQQPSQAKTADRPAQIWWLVPSLIAGCVCALLFPYLHMRFGTTTQSRELVTAVVNLAIFLATYFFFRRSNVMHSQNWLVSLLLNIAVAAPVFIIAWFGLAYEIPELADFGGMYIIATWIATSELAERGQEQE